jgi:membrane-bound lytic murein transglycosylase D
MRSQPHVIDRFLAVAVLASIISGCAALQKGANPTRMEGRGSGNRYSLLPPSESTYIPNASSVPDEIVFRPKLPAEGYDSTELHFDHPRIEAFVLDYETRSRGFFERALDRSAKYISRMTAILREEGVPAELAYLPLIESGFNPFAVSPAGAVGPWQFIPATGRRYGLRIDRYVDERRDPDKSTRAAAQYLRDLYNMFGDWHLSLAAYNTGEYRVARTMDREGTDSYWDLMENRDLHPETCDYVPRFLAALAIAKAPEAHGFASPEPQTPRFDQVAVDRSVSLRQIAELVGASESEIKDLNPALVRGVTPPDASGYDVHLPPGTKDQFALGYARLLHDARDAQALPSAVADGDRYRVRKGDTAAAVARRFGVSVQALLRANGLQSAKNLRAGRVLRVPGSSAPASATVARAQKSAPARVAAAPSTYRVKKGDTPAGVAKRLGVSTRALLQHNGIKNAKALRHGATLRIPPKAKTKPEPIRVARAQKR